MSIRKRSLEAIIFDLGNTLIYFDGDWGQVIESAEIALFEYLQNAGLKLDRSRFLEVLHARLLAYYQEREISLLEKTTQAMLCSTLNEMGFDELSDGEVQFALDAFYAKTQKSWKVEEDAVETLKWLNDQGYLLGLISNAGDDRDVQALVDMAGIRPYFDCILTSAAQGIRKPDERIFRAILECWNVSAVQTAMVGDNLIADIKGAQNLGIFSIWIKRRIVESADGQVITPDAVIASLNELPVLLESLGNI
jgi:HAD superfamily hydrolase (TIGR01549 family)